MATIEAATAATILDLADEGSKIIHDELQSGLPWLDSSIGEGMFPWRSRLVTPRELEPD